MLNPHESGSATESSEERCPVYPGICHSSTDEMIVLVAELPSVFLHLRELSCLGEEGSLVYALVINAVRAKLFGYFVPVL